ncbi:gp19.1 [Streptomyces phage phiBT1]|uniref:Gp19.1 n=1 Tax=Lomovskayavirus BT1 TaxID=225588 RepID=Q858Y3_9CAUD|nr:gp19.1 [Streptomyces phage phiBT1]CAD80142.1 gp19.1 [Lomovskayavirus BT1]
MQYGTASAEATQDSAGAHTYTVRATFSDQGYSSTEQLHLTLDAALELRAALDDVLP